MPLLDRMTADSRTTSPIEACTRNWAIPSNMQHQHATNANTPISRHRNIGSACIQHGHDLHKLTYLAACCSTGDADKKRSFPFHTAVAESHLFGDENFTTPRRRSAFTSVHCRKNLGSPNEEAGGLEAFDMDPNVDSWPISSFGSGYMMKRQKELRMQSVSFYLTSSRLVRNRSKKMIASSVIAS